VGKLTGIERLGEGWVEAGAFERSDLAIGLRFDSHQ
jgi:hypothetical protein